MRIIFIHGFLGSGKTTLAKQLINQRPLSKTAYLVNELGRGVVDQTLVAKEGLDTFPANNGQLLGRLANEAFPKLLTDLLAQDYDDIIVETSGYDDPLTLAAKMSELSDQLGQRLDYYSIAIVEGVSFPLLINKLMLMRRHLQVADLVIINKCDLITATEQRNLQKQVAKISKAPQIKTINCFSEQLADNLTRIKKPVMYGQRKRNLELRYFSLAVDSKTSSQQLNELLWCMKERVYRAKGILQLSDGRFSCQLASRQIEISESDKATTPLSIWYSSDDIIEPDIVELYKSVSPLAAN